mgnify:CR=1 FL=1
MKQVDRNVVDAITKKLVDDGLLIEAGWRSYQLMVIPEGASKNQLDESRKAFFAGAQHLWGSIFSFLEEGSMETPNDLRRMDLIDKELKRFVAELGH